MFSRKRHALLTTCVTAFLASASIAPGLATATPSRVSSPVAKTHGSFQVATTNYILTFTRRTATSVYIDRESGGIHPATNVYGPKTFTPQSNTFSDTDTHARLESAYNYSSPGTYSWRFDVNTALCTGGTLQGLMTANVYNNGGLVPNTHYSKGGVSPCNGFHSMYPGNSKINTKGNYELSGGLTWKKGNATYNLDFTFTFIITLV